MDNLGDLVSRIALALQEENLTVTTDGDHWTAAEIIGYINDVQLEFVGEAKTPKIDSLVPVQENVFIYNKPADMLEVEGGIFLGLPIGVFTETQMDHQWSYQAEGSGVGVNEYPTPFGRTPIIHTGNRESDSWRFKTGKPLGIIMNDRSQDTFRLYKIPDETYSYTVAHIQDSTNSLYGVLISMGINTSLLGVMPDLTYIPQVHEDPDTIYGVTYSLDPTNFLQEDSQLSGTVSTTTGNKTIVGVNTQFRTELEVYDTIKIMNSVIDVMVVTKINSDLELEVDDNTLPTVTESGKDIYESAGWVGVTNSSLGFLSEIKLQNVIQLKGVKRPATLTTGTPATTRLTVAKEYYKAIMYGVLELAWAKQGLNHNKGQADYYGRLFRYEIEKARSRAELSTGSHYRTQRHPGLTVR